MKKAKVLVLRTAGTNCDKETAFAFRKAGADSELVHINQLKVRKKDLSDYQILALPGGFSYGDDLAAGKILANELKYKLINEIRKFIDSGKLIIGICNGFQVLVKSGILPGNPALEQEATLTINDSAKFEDRWVYLKRTENRGQKIEAGSEEILGGAARLCDGKPQARTKLQKPAVCVWTQGLPEIVYMPVAHGEGKFLVKDKTVLERLKRNNQIVFRYCNETGEFAPYPYNPNGSQDNIAGICDGTGRIFGLMPHPERHSFSWQHPRWRAIGNKRNQDTPEGLQIFRNGVEYAKKCL